MKKHGMCKRNNRHPFYICWVSMRQRCRNIKHIEYKNYGARGIKVCDRWLESFDNFYKDMFSSWQKGLQLDRIDNNKGYSPENCKWSTPSKNSKNRRNKSHIQSTIDYVNYDKKRKKWVVMIPFDNKEEAEICAVFLDRNGG